MPAAWKVPQLCHLPPVVGGQTTTGHKVLASHSAATSQTASDAKVILFHLVPYSLIFEKVLPVPEEDRKPLPANASPQEVFSLCGDMASTHFVWQGAGVQDQISRSWR